MRLRNISGIFLILYLMFCAFNNAIEISIQQGILNGKQLESRNGTKFHAFLGIPYAKPPVGELRFEPPQNPDSWDGIRNATEQPPHCIQKEIFTFDANLQDIVGQEDCLYLNVYTPAKISKPLPVMVYIHGGAFIVGGSGMQNPSYFMDHDILIVVIQYRLNILGFLSTGDNIVPGNNGLKDQVAALKWVQKNIASFGGDPTQITIFGESAGASCVHFHLLSPLSKGLFQRAISQSGSSLAIWAYTPRQIARAKAQSLGVITSCSIKNSKALIQCLKKLPAEEIIAAHNKFYAWDFDPVIPFGIVDEPNAPEAFLTKNPWYQEQINVVPWIVGINSGDGGVKAGRYLHNNGKLAAYLNKHYKILFPKVFYYTYFFEDDNKISEITETLKQFYFNDKNISTETYKELINIFTDGFFAFGSIEAAHRSKGPVYFYYYDHKNERTFNEIFGDFKGDFGACHADDLISLFQISIFPKITEGKDFHVSKKLINYWINFAYTGNPNYENTTWKPLTSDNFEYLYITSHEDVMREGLLKERYLFWKNLQLTPSTKSYTDEL